MLGLGPNFHECVELVGPKVTASQLSFLSGFFITARGAPSSAVLVLLAMLSHLYEIKGMSTSLPQSFEKPENQNPQSPSKTPRPLSHSFSPSNGTSVSRSTHLAGSPMSPGYTTPTPAPYQRASTISASLCISKSSLWLYGRHAEEQILDSLPGVGT